MREMEFSYDRTVPRGRVVFRVHNVGTLDHQLVLTSLPEDAPPIDEQLRSPTARGLATLVSLPARPPGSSSTFATNLAPGRYALICFVEDPDGVQHSRKGMSSEFRVGAPTAPGSSPRAPAPSAATPS